MDGKKIRLLRIAFNDLGHGGIQTQLMTVTKELGDKINSDIIVWSNKEAFFDDEFRKYGRIIYCPHYEGRKKIRLKMDYFIRYLKIKHDVYKVIREYGPYDAVHCHKFFECAPCLAAAKKAGVPVRIAHSHNTEKPTTRKNIAYYMKRILNNYYRKLIRKYATHMIGCSQAAADYLFGKGYGYPVYNSIDLSKFSLEKYNKDPHSEIRLIHVGKFCEQKNQLFLLDVFAEIRKMNPNVSLTMIGHGGKYYEQTIKKIAKLNLEDCTQILPHDTDVASTLADSDYFVFPSTFEGFGNVLLEAQAMGLKCFVSTEVTQEADCGLLTYIPLSKGAQEWAKEILSYYEKNGVVKRPQDLTNFSPQRTASNMLKLYRGESL